MGRKRGRPPRAETRLKQLSEQLRSKNLAKRLSAIDSLREFRRKEVVSLLAKNLYDESWHVRSHAARALGGFGKTAIPSLMKALSDGIWYVRAAASIALGEVGDIETVDSLLSLIDEENRTVRKEAREAISKIVKKDPHAFVKEYLERRDDDLRRDFLQRLKSLDEEAYTLIRQAEEEA